MHKERMASNLAIDDFELSAEDMEALRRMDTGRSVADFNDPAMAKYLIEYDRKFNPNR